MISVIQLAEADDQIGFGHLRELHALQQSFRKEQAPVSTFVLGARTSAEQSWANAQWVDSSETLSRLLSGTRATVSIWSFRRRLDSHLEKLLTDLGEVRVWITDQPDEPLAVDVLVVPVITRNTIAGWQAKMLQGLEYFPLDASYSNDPVGVGERPHEVLLSLGGSDPSKATLRLLPDVAGFDSTVVIGPGFVHADEVKSIAARFGIRHIDTPNGLQELLRTHRIVVTAGGNTLIEAAASGTPALVAWEDPHERDQGEAFERLGAAMVLGQGNLLDPTLLNQRARALLDDPALLTAMMTAGRRAVDGRGADRIVEAVLRQARHQQHAC